MLGRAQLRVSAKRTQRGKMPAVRPRRSSQLNLAIVADVSIRFRRILRSLARLSPRMIDAERIPLPPGLPVHLSNGSEGYEALCKLLGLTNRGERQRLANSLPVKQFLKSSGNAPPPNSKTAERIRHNLIAWFSEPDERRKSWRYFHQRELGDKAVSTRFPCLVRAALSEYDAAFLTSDPDPERLTELKAFYDAKIIDDDWRAPRPRGASPPKR